MVEIKKITPADWQAIKKIYQEGIDTGNATFETDTKDWEYWDKNHINRLRLLARKDSHIAGWAALSNVSSRCVYAGVAEVSIYVSAKYRGQRIGSALLSALIEMSEKENIWTLQGGIFPENKASVVLFEKCDFRKVGIREKVGKMNGQWRDVLLMERRSNITGI